MKLTRKLALVLLIGLLIPGVAGAADTVKIGLLAPLRAGCVYLDRNVVLRKQQSKVFLQLSDVVPRREEVVHALENDRDPDDGQDDEKPHDPGGAKHGERCESFLYIDHSFPRMEGRF